MQSDLAGSDLALFGAARRSYELGRLSHGARVAAIATAILAAITAQLYGTHALLFVPLAFLALTASEWRGRLFMKGARRGAVAGLISLLLPLSILRPCCATGTDLTMMSTRCCTMPAACWSAGAALGLVLALSLPFVRTDRRLATQVEVAAGMIVGVVAVTFARCSVLFFGEALGLVGGLAIGVVATSVARGWWDSRNRLAGS